jgi:L-alanine-DL-glutamate epimerase-like enolase superfamily enzyme
MNTNGRRLSWEPITLHLRNPFRVSYGVSETRRAHWIRLEDDSGWGEGTIPPYYGVETAAMEACWEAAALRWEPFPDDPAGIARWVGQDGPAPARAALDLALHDRAGRLAGLPVFELLDLPRPQSMPTSITIGIDTPENMAQAALRLRDYPVIKLKLGGPNDIACLAAVRQARPDARLMVDANAAWSTETALANVAQMIAYDLELVEQPVAKADIAGMGRVQERCPIPVVADESLQTLADLEALAAAGVRGVNLKLMKLGGLTPGVRALRRAQELGMRIMLGCMIETSIGVTAMAHLSGLADWLDLDAPLLVADDPFQGLRFDTHGNITLPDAPGIGAIART